MSDVRPTDDDRERAARDERERIVAYMKQMAILSGNKTIHDAILALVSLIETCACAHCSSDQLVGEEVR